MIQKIYDYKSILASMEDLINESPLKKNYIIEQAGLTAPTFYRKLKNLSFTPDEVLCIIKLLRPKEAALMELKEGLKRSDDDYKNGRVHEHQDIIDEIRKEFLNQ